MNFPPLPIETEAEISERKQRNDADLTIVTVCDNGCVTWGQRLGCACGKWVGDWSNGEAYWAYLAADGRVLKHDIDVSII